MSKMAGYFNEGTPEMVSQFLTIMSNMAVDFRQPNQPRIEKDSNGISFLIRIYGYSLTFFATITDPDLAKKVIQKLDWNKANLASKIPELLACEDSLSEARRNFIDKETESLRALNQEAGDYLKALSQRDLRAEAEKATTQEYEVYIRARNKVYLGLNGLHPNDYFEKIDVPVRFQLTLRRCVSLYFIGITQTS